MRIVRIAAGHESSRKVLGDRSLDTFTTFVVKDLTDSVIVHDRSQNS